MDLSLIGTGLMGRPMAERLLEAGHRVTVYNRSREKALPLEEKGARLAATSRQAVEASECTVLMVRDGEAIRSLLYEGGRLPDLADRTLLQMSTIGPRESMALMADVQAAGGDYLEAPVLGSTPQASDGQLLVMVGGTAAQVERWMEVLACFGPEPRLIGPVGQAAALKLALNQLIASLTAAFSLSLGLVRRRGIDSGIFMEFLRGSALYAPTFDKKLPRYLERDFSQPHFPLKHLLKDVELVLAEAGELGLDSAILEAVRDVVAKGVESSLADGDYSALFNVVDPPPDPPGR